MDGVGTSIVGRPRRLSADRRARPTYTFIWEEPEKVGLLLRVCDIDGWGYLPGDRYLRRGRAVALPPPESSAAARSPTSVPTRGTRCPWSGTA
ncbi:hypothetical protein DSP71_19545 [Microbacterium sp. H6]|nr:hypothetical protein DSP71_19545 [Microbacterium sp. H6]